MSWSVQGTLAISLLAMTPELALAQVAPSAVPAPVVPAPAAGSPAVGAPAASPSAPTEVKAPRAPAVDFVLETSRGVQRSLSGYRGRVVVLFYEDRHHTETNATLKEALGKLNASLPPEQRFAFVPIANLQGLDFFPAAGIARSAVKDAAKKHNVEIWMDWDGTVIRRAGLRDDDANVAVVDAAGVVRFRAHGALGQEQQRALVAAIAASR